MLLVRARLEVRDLTVALPTRNGWVRPVAQVSFTLNEGESLGIVGESGSGKTMLSLALMGLSPPGARASGEATLRTSTNGSSDGSSEHTIDLLKASPVEPGKFCGTRVIPIPKDCFVRPLGFQAKRFIRSQAPFRHWMPCRLGVFFRRAVRVASPNATHGSPNCGRLMSNIKRGVFLSRELI